MSPLKNPSIEDAAIKISNLSIGTKRKTLVIDGNSLIYHIIAEYNLGATIAQNGAAYWKFEQVRVRK